MTHKELLEKIKEGSKVTTNQEFSEYVQLFLQDDISSDRLNLYIEKMKAEKLPNLAAAKNEILKQIFSDYIQYTLMEANLAAIDEKPLEAKRLVEQLNELRSVFKNHDVNNYKDFILESDSKMSEIEVELLFFEPELSTEELGKLSEAFLKAFGKKNTELSDKDDYQEKFFNHPLIQCLDGYSDFKTIQRNVSNGTIQLGTYEYLIKSLLELRGKINAEEYQGFITYVIHEDLNYGLANILKNDSYKPETLRHLLKNLSEGVDFTNDKLKEIMLDIKENHTHNLALNEKKELARNISSTFSLNDYGFKTKLPNSGRELFFHGHATENSGSKQFEQQANTANACRAFGLDTIGLTVLKEEVTRTDHHSTFIREAKLSHLVHLTKTEEVVLSGLQFDGSYVKNLATQVKKEEDLQSGDLLGSNHYIIKSDIARSQRVIRNNLGKNDLELLCEKKNAYLLILEKNKELIKTLVDITSTNNQLSYQLLCKPLADFVKGALKIEKTAQIKLFSQEELRLVKEVFSVHTLNVDLASVMSDTLDAIENRRVERYKDIKVESYKSLVDLCVNDKELKVVSTEDNLPKEHLKILNRPYATMGICLKYLEENPISLPGYTNAYKNKVANKLIQKIESESDDLLKYRSDKKENLRSNILEIAEELKNGQSMHFNKSDWASTDSRYVWLKTLSSLFKTDGKTEEQKRNDLLLLRGLLSVAEISGAKIFCGNQDLRKKISP